MTLFNRPGCSLGCARSLPVPSCSCLPPAFAGEPRNDGRDRFLTNEGEAEIRAVDLPAMRSVPQRHRTDIRSENRDNLENDALIQNRLGLALSVHVADEALTDFLSVYNPAVEALRERLPWFPLPTFTFEGWLTGLIVGGGALAAVVPLRLRRRPVDAIGLHGLRRLHAPQRAGAPLRVVLHGCADARPRCCWPRRSTC